MELRSYLGVLRRNLRLILGSGAAMVILAMVVTSQVTPVFESKSRILVSSPEPGTSEAYAGGLLSAQRVAGYAALVDSEILAQRVQRVLDTGMATDELSEEVDASTVEDTGVLSITVRDSERERAEKIAQAYAEQLVALSAEIETPKGADRPTVSATVIDGASTPGDPVWPKPLATAVLAAFFGLALGLAGALVREVLDTSVKEVGDIADLTSAPLLGTITQDASASDRLLSELNVYAPRVEAFRVLRTNVQFVEVDRSNKVLVVTSPLQGDGKSSTAVNLAISLAQSGLRVLLVDGDLRQSSVARLMGVERSVGLTTVLLGRVTLDEAVQHHGGHGLDVLTSGVAPPNPTELLHSQAMAALLDRVRKDYDIVIVDSPPLVPVIDAALIASRADGALLVLRHGRTTRPQVATAVQRLEQVDASLCGVVMNQTPQSRSAAGYAYKPYAPPPGRRAAPRARRADRGIVEERVT